ncbi:MAG: B12-binding domain-containing radical SAM protein [Candidatus Hodarchaeota archaeon]
MRVLLVNPNTYKKPPVIPLGLEYLLTYLRGAGHNVDVLDLCFSDDPRKEIDEIFLGKSYDLVGVTIRNVDSSIYFNNQFFLKDIKNIIDMLKGHGVPIVLGGAGYSAMPSELLDYFNADFGIEGPGEMILLRLLEDLEQGKADYTVLNGWNYSIDTHMVHERGKDFNYSKYVEGDSVLGFETQKGCPGGCSYCIEAKTGTKFKPPEVIVEEIRHLVDLGYHHFHLCDSEFNLDLNRSKAFCRAMIEADLDMKWALYMKPTPQDDELFALLKDSKVYMITCSISSDKAEQARCNYDLDDIGNFVDCCKKHELGIFFDLLVGFPGEPRASIEEMIEFLRKKQPNSVGVSFNFRLFKKTLLTSIVWNDPALRNNFSRKWTKNENFIKPIFFNQVDLEYIKSLVEGDDLFRIEGFQQNVNYQRL